jgi:transketolase
MSPLILALGRRTPVSRGAYVLAEAEGGSPDVILISTGSELSLSVVAREKLKDYGVKSRVVSMPSWSLFEAQDSLYRESVLPRDIKKRVTVEGKPPRRLDSIAGRATKVQRFGASAPGQDVLTHLGFTADRVAAPALRLLGKDIKANQEYGSE